MESRKKKREKPCYFWFSNYHYLVQNPFFHDHTRLISDKKTNQSKIHDHRVVTYPFTKKTKNLTQIS